MGCGASSPAGRPPAGARATVEAPIKILAAPEVSGNPAGGAVSRQRLSPVPTEGAGSAEPTPRISITLDSDRGGVANPLESTHGTGAASAEPTPRILDEAAAVAGLAPTKADLAVTPFAAAAARSKSIPMWQAQLQRETAAGAAVAIVIFTAGEVAVCVDVTLVAEALQF